LFAVLYFLFIEFDGNQGFLLDFICYCFMLNGNQGFSIRHFCFSLGHLNGNHGFSIRMSQIITFCLGAMWLLLISLCDD